MASRYLASRWSLDARVFLPLAFIVILEKLAIQARLFRHAGKDWIQDPRSSIYKTVKEEQKLDDWGHGGLIDSLADSHVPISSIGVWNRFCSAILLALVSGFSSLIQPVSTEFIKMRCLLAKSSADVRVSMFKAALAMLV